MLTSIIEAMVELIGITWNHTRGYLPMVATAQRFSELRPHVSIAWHKRSLQAFADAPLVDLAARFDLMVIDHPSIGLGNCMRVMHTKDTSMRWQSTRPRPSRAIGRIYMRVRSNHRRR